MNTKIDFYILEEASLQDALRFACHLVEKAYLEQKKIIVEMDTLQDAERFDTLLWTYRDASFIPRQHEGKSIFVPNKRDEMDILINLSGEIPSIHEEVNCVIEIVFSDPIVQQSARERFRAYRERGYEITTHKENIAKAG